MLKTARVLIGVAVGAVVFAAPATADASAWVRTMQDQYVFLSDQQLIDTAGKICAATRRGVAAPAVVTMVSDDLGISVPASNVIVNSAVVGFGC